MITTGGGSDHPILFRSRPNYEPTVAVFSARACVEPLLALFGHGSHAEGELRSLATERDPELFYEGLLGLAGRLECDDRLDLAAQIYVELVRDASSFGAGASIAHRAQERLNALLGRGSVGVRAEGLLRNLARQASDPSMIFAMGAAGAVFRMTRLATLSGLASQGSRGFLTQWMGAGRLASLAGFAIEAPTFTLASRLGAEAMGRPSDWSARALGRDLASSYLVLGGLKLASWGSAAAYRRLVPMPTETMGSRAVAALFQQGGTFSGILFGQFLEERFGLRSHGDPTHRLVDSLAMLLQFHVAGRLTRIAFGPGFSTWEAGLDRQAESLARPGPRWNWPQGFGDILLPQAAMAKASPGSSTRPEIGFPQVSMMVGQGNGGGRRVDLPVEARYWLSQVENENVRVALSATARLQDMLSTGEDLSSRQFVEVFRQLYRKTDGNIEMETYDLIIDGLNKVLEKLDVRQSGPRALFREMMRPERTEDLIVPGFHASWLRNPSLGRSARARIVDRVSEILRRDDIENDVPHDQALTLVGEAADHAHLETPLYQILVKETVRFAQRMDSWFNEFEPSRPISRRILSDRRVDSDQQERLLQVIRGGLRDSSLRSQDRVDILQFLENLALDSRVSASARAWLQGELPGLRENFLRENLEEVRHYGKSIENHAELGYLLTRDYVESDVKILLARELFVAFKGFPPTSMGYDHLASIANVYVSHPSVPVEARFHLWNILLKASMDFASERNSQEEDSQRIEMWRNTLPRTLSRMPRGEGAGLAAYWVQRLSGGSLQQRVHASRMLEAMLPYLEPNFDLRTRLARAAEGNILEIRVAVDRVLAHWNRVN